MNGLGGPIILLRLAVHGGLGEVSVGQWAAFHRGVSGVLFADVGQRIFYFFVFYDDLGVVGAQLFVAFDDDVGHDLELGLESQRLSVVDVQVGHLRLRNRNQALLFGFFTEVAGNEGLDHIALQIFFEALPRDGIGNVRRENRASAPLLILLTIFSISRATSSAGISTEISRLMPSFFAVSSCAASGVASFLLTLAVSVGLTFPFRLAVRLPAVLEGPGGKDRSCHTPLILSVKTKTEQRQTPKRRSL